MEDLLAYTVEEFDLSNLILQPCFHQKVYSSLYVCMYVCAFVHICTYISACTIRNTAVYIIFDFSLAGHKSHIPCVSLKCSKH